MEEGGLEIATPHSVQKNVFKRLYAGRKAEVKAHESKSSRIELASNKSKGRHIPSKFSGSIPSTRKHESQKQNAGGKRLSFKTPVAKAQSGSTIKRFERVSLSVRHAKNKLQSARYWLSLIEVAEKAENHVVSIGFFEMAVACAAEPVTEVKKALAAYRARYKLEKPSLKDSSLKAEAATQAEVELNLTKSYDNQLKAEAATQAEVELNLTKSYDNQVEALETVNDADESEVIVSTEVDAVKNLCSDTPVETGTEAATPISLKARTSGAEDDDDDSVSEVINEDYNDQTSKLNSVTKKPPERVVPRRTPRRACAIVAAQRIEESARKQTRRKFCGAKADDLEVEKMDVNTLIKEVVSSILPGELADSLVQESASENSPNKTSSEVKLDEHFQVINESVKSTKRTNEDNKRSKSKISEKENVQEMEKRELNKPVAESPAEARRSARLRSTPTKTKMNSSKALPPPFHC